MAGGRVAVSGQHGLRLEKGPGELWLLLLGLRGRTIHGAAELRALSFLAAVAPFQILVGLYGVVG